MAKHFNQNEHSIHNFRIMAVEVPRDNNVVHRRIREMIWVKRVKTIENGENNK